MSAATLVAAFGWTLVHFVWQGALLGCVTAALLTLLRNARPGLRYLVACGALLLCLAWPAAELILLLGAGEAAANGGPLLAAMAARGGADGAQGVPGALLGWLQDHLGMLVALWAACTGALGLRMMAGLLWIGRAARTQAGDPAWQARLTRLAAQCGLDREVRLRVVDSLASPITAGWWRPVVLVPASLIAGMPPQLLEALLAHELGHVRRHDYLVNLVQNVIESLLFYHPAVWWISSRIRLEREQIADDFAARQLGEPRRLAQALSELERLQFSCHHLAQAANGGDLMARIRRLLRPGSQALSWKAAIPVLGLALMCAAGAHVPDGVAPSPRHASTGHTGAGPTRAPVADFAGCRKPRYPQADIAGGHEGTVIVDFLVDREGKVKDSKIARSSGFGSMDEAARGALVQCRFSPGLKRGKPVEQWVSVQYVWTLQ